MRFTSPLCLVVLCMLVVSAVAGPWRFQRRRDSSESNSGSTSESSQSSESSENKSGRKSCDIVCARNEDCPEDKPQCVPLTIKYKVNNQETQLAVCKAEQQQEEPADPSVPARVVEAIRPTTDEMKKLAKCLVSF